MASWRRTRRRQAVMAYVGLPMGDEAAATAQVAVAAEDLPEAGSNKPSSTIYLWAMLIARIYEVLDEIHPCISHYVQLSAAQIRSRRICPLVCPQCGGELSIPHCGRSHSTYSDLYQ